MAYIHEDPTARLLAATAERMREAGEDLFDLACEKAKSITIRIEYHSGHVQEFGRDFPTKERG